MTLLFQPPPLLTMLVVLAVAAGALWWGLRLRSPRDLLRPAGSDDAVVPVEDREVWGTPDPLPPARVPFSYDRLVVEPDQSAEPEPASAAGLGDLGVPAGAEMRGQEVVSVDAERQQLVSPRESPTDSASVELPREPVMFGPQRGRVEVDPEPSMEVVPSPTIAVPRDESGAATQPVEPAERVEPEQRGEAGEAGEPGATREISLAEIFTRAQRRDDRE